MTDEAKAEREAVVRYLRALTEEWGGCDRQKLLEELADAIEQGQHSTLDLKHPLHHNRTDN